jgi:peptide/nickel transport system substrate-binding protein
LRVEVREAPPHALAFEALVRLDASGAPQPWLATSWQHDASARRWQFTLRPRVKLHDGSQFTAAAAAAIVQSAIPAVSVSAAGETLVVRGTRAMPNLLLDLAHDAWFESGPFRPTAGEPGHRATFAANEDYWGGRPFLDGVDVQLGRGLRDEFADLELGKADVAEVAPADVRRAAARGLTIWSSAPIELIAVTFANDRPDERLREALALSIDRSAMHAVLLQKKGEATGALLPQWISGYAFAFPVGPDLARARALSGAVPLPARTVTLACDPSLRALAERVAVNARDAGLTIQVSTQNPHADARLVSLPVTSLDPEQALAGLSGALGLGAPAHADTASALYEAERKLLAGARVIPLFHMPVLYGAAAQVRIYDPPPVTRLGDWRFENIWLMGTAP